MPRSQFLAWSDSDRDWVLAFIAEEHATCPGCGQPVDETHEPEAEHLLVPKVSKCHGCGAIEAQAEALAKDEQVRTHGLKLGVEKRA